MDRRFFLKFAAILPGFGATAAAATVATAATPAKQKIVYHVSDHDKVGFTLGNIRNHIDGVGGPDHVEIILVAHGPAVKAFHEIEADPKIAERIAALQGQGVQFHACGNTMRAQGVTLADLIKGFVLADQGGVVRIAELQGQGYLYIRP